MRNQRITDTDAAALVRGTAPADLPELTDVATALSAFRSAVGESLPQPSATLRERLELGFTPVTASASPEGKPRSRTGSLRRVVAWLASLGLAAKIVLASTVAVAAVAGAGTVGVLPGGAQDVFNTVVSTVGLDETPPAEEPVTEEPPAEEPVSEESVSEEAVTDEPVDEPADETDDTDGPAEGENFGSYVSEEAKNKEGSGREFGEKISELAKNNGNGNGQTPEPEDDASTDSTTDKGSGKPSGGGTGGKKS